MNILKSAIIATVLLFIGSTSLAFETPTGSGTGTVAETMDAGGYTYVRLAEDGRWVAGPTTKVAIGDNVVYAEAVEMGQFHSRALNRNFEQILFAQRLKVTNLIRAEAHADSSAVSKMGDELGIEKTASSEVMEIGDIEPIDGGKTIGAIRTDFQQLDGQQVQVRARVMKVSENILGKNWITLQDGTGTPPENKLLATSAELVKIGDLVTARGMVKTNVDLGSGYKYKVVLEETTFTK